MKRVRLRDQRPLYYHLRNTDIQGRFERFKSLRNHCTRHLWLEEIMFYDLRLPVDNTR